MSKSAAIAAELPRLRRYARALTGDNAEADDLVQDCLARALANRAQWRYGESPRKWLFTILHNLHIDGRRRDMRRPQQVQIEAADLDRQIAASQNQGPGVLDIQDAVGQLDDDQRQVLLLVALEGLSYAEAADVLAIPIGTVMSRISRARARLRDTLYGGSGGTTRLKRVK